MQFGAVGGGEAHVGEHVGLGVVHDGGELGHPGAYLIRNGAPLGAGGLWRLLREGGADEGRDDPPPALAGMGNRTPLKTSPFRA